MTASPLGCGLGEPRAPSFILGYPAAPVVTPLLINNTVEFSLTEVSLVLEDLSLEKSLTDGGFTRPRCFTERLENEVMVDPWSSMESSNSPLTDSPSTGSEDSTPSASEPAEPCGPAVASASTSAATCNDKTDALHSLENTKTQASRNDQCQISKPSVPSILEDKPRARDLTLDLENLDPELAAPRRRHFLDEDYQLPLRSNIDACRIPKPHFLDHSPSPDDERSDITNPNFLDEDPIDICDDSLQSAKAEAHRRSGAFPKRPDRPHKVQSSHFPMETERPHRTHYRSHLHYGLERAAHSSERDKRASQLYHGTWPGDGWPGQDTASVRSFSSAGSANAPHSGSSARQSAHIETKMECVYSLLSLLSLSPDNNADLSGPLLEMSKSVESCVAMRQSGCIPLLVQLIHSKFPRDTRNKAAQALHNIIHTQPDDKSGRREARVWRLLEQVREYCYVLEDTIEGNKDIKDTIDEGMTRHPSQSVAALMKLSFDEEHRHVVCQLGGLQALATLVSADQTAHGSHIEEGTCVTMRKYAGMTLTNLTFGDGNNKSLLCSFKDFMLALVEQLQSPNDDMRQVTSAVLRNLSWRADSNSKQVLREVGAVTGLTQAAMTCQKEATLKSVLSALWNLTAHCSMNKVALCSVDGALGFLVDMLSYNSPTKTLAIVENAGGIMRNVSSHIAIREDYRQILRERNCLSVLLQHLKSPSLTVVSNSCGTLWNLSARCPLDQQFLWDHGAVPMLRSLIHSKHKMIAMGSSAALKNLLNSKPGKNHIISLDSTARSMNLPVLPTLGARKQKALEQEIDQNLAETCDNIEPATSPSITNRDEKNLFSATERQLAMNLERHRMTSSSPLMGTLPSQSSLSHSAHLAGYLSCSNTLLKSSLVTRSVTGTSSASVNRSDSKDSVMSAHSDSVFEKATRIPKVPIPTPRSMKIDDTSKSEFAKPNDGMLLRYQTQPPVPPPRSGTEISRNNFTESGYDVDQDSCDQPIDFSRKYSETKSSEPSPVQLLEESKVKADIEKCADKDSEDGEKYGDYQETDLDQPTDYSLRYAEHQSEASSDSEPLGPSVHEDTIQHFCTEGTPYETPIVFSTATSISDLRVIAGRKDQKKPATNIKTNSEVMTQSDEKDTCSVEEPPHDNDVAVATSKSSSPPTKIESEKTTQFDTKFSSGMISPEKPVNYCDEGTPGCFSRVSSLSSLGDLADETSLAKKNAMATINMDSDLPEKDASTSARDKDGSKAVTFATEPAIFSQPEPDTPGATSVHTTSPPPQSFVEDTPLMFSRCSSPSSLSGCSIAEPMDDQGSMVSEISRLTSGCISPSEIPDSPGQSIPQSPRPRARSSHPAHPARGQDKTPPNHGGLRSVFEERVSTFQVENTPAQFSTATSLSSLTIDDEPSPSQHGATYRESNGVTTGQRPERATFDTWSETSQVTSGDSSTRLEPHDRIITPMTAVPAMMGHEPCTDSNPHREVQQPVDTCYTYFTEDTPAVLSKMGSDGNLSALSVETSAEPLRPVDNSSSDSSNLSDTGENLLNECIQKGIAKVLKNGSHSTEPLPANITQYPPKDQLYRSLPPYLVSSTETVKIQPEPMLNPSVHANVCRSDANSPNRTAHPLSSDESPPPPLPPKFNLGGVIRPPPRPPALLSIAVVAPASPPLSLGSDDERIFNQAIQQGIEKLKERKESRLPVKASSTKPPTNLVRNDSLSSLSIDSFGSTDREIFEECVNAGLSKVNPKAIFTLESKGKAHSVERVLETDPYRSSHRNHKSLDRSDKISNHRPHQSDLERLALAHQKKDKTKKKESGGMTRASHSYHGDTAAHSLAHHSRWGAPRYHDDGPPSLPVRIESHSSVVLERSNSLSSLSGESFGSTDKEVFDRIVKLGMKSIPKAKGDIKLDRPELRGSDFTIERPKLRIDNGEFRMVPEVRESHRSRRRRSDLLSLRPPAGALDKMTGEEDSMDRALLEEMIARGAGEIRPPNVSQSKNVQAPSVGRAPADGGVAPRDASAHLTPHTSTPRSGSDSQHHGLFNPNIYDTNSPNIGSDINSAHSGFNINNSDTSNMYTTDRDNTNDITLEFELNQSNEQPTVDSENTTSAALGQMDRSNEYHAIVSANTTIESEKDILDKSNESYADVLDGSVWSDIGSPPENYDCATLTRSNKNMKWTEINITSDNSDKKLSKKSTDTWNDNTCPDDVTFPTISGSVPMVASFKSDAADISTALPDLLEESLISNRSFTGPDLTDQLDEDRSQKITTINNMHTNFECIQDENEPSFNSLVNDVSNFNSMTASTIIEREAAQLVARLSNGFENQAMASSVLSYDLDSVKPPSNMGSLVSLTQSISGQLEDTTSLQSKKRQKSRKKSLPISLMVKRALTNSMTYHSSNEHLDSCPVSILDNVKPPSEMEHMDMESSMISVASIASEVAEQKENNNVIFDFDQPVSVFMTNPLNDLDHVNPPSLFNELGENTLEFEHTTALEMYDYCISNTLNLTTDFASGSEYCSPLQSDLSSVESTPKRMRNSKYLTPKEKRQLSKERYQTYTIADENTNQTDETISVNHVELESDLTLESDSRSEDYAIARSEHKSKRKISAKQRRLEDRARYQTQTVNISSIPLSNTVEKSPDPEIEHLKRRLAAKKTMRQKRLDDAERFRTRTIGDDVPPSPTYVTCDANFENFETTTGYDSFSSSELNHQQVTDDRVKSSDDNSTVDLQADSGTNDDDFELNSTQMQTYTKTFRNYLPVIESPTAVDICIVNNLKNIEMTASYRKTTPTYNIESIKDAEQQPGSSDFNSYEVEDNSDNSDSEPETLPIKVKPKIIKPTEIRRDASLDSNGSCDNDTPKGIRGRRKPVYVSPYKRTMPVVRKSPVRSMAPKLAPVVKPVTKLPVNPKVQAASKTRTPNKPFGSKIPSNIPPKKTPIDIPAKPSTSQNVSVPSVAVKPLPIERQGTFTKEESSVLPKERTFDKKSTVPLRLAKTGPVVKQSVNTSPSRLPQPKTGIVRPPLRKTLSNEPKQAPKKPNNTPNRTSLPAMKNSASNQSLQSNDSAKTVTLASKSDSRNGSTTNVNSSSSKVPKEVASKIASLWKRVEQSKQQQIKPDKRVWIGHTDIVVPESSESPKLIRSSTFEGPPGQITPVVAAPKTKSSIAIRVSQIPSSRFGSRPGTSKNVDKPSVTNGAVRRPTGVKVFTRKQLNNQEIAT